MSHKAVKSQYKVKPSQEELDQEVVFKKRGEKEQLQHELAIAHMTIQQLKTHLGYMAILTFVFFMILMVILIIWVFGKL